MVMRVLRLRWSGDYLESRESGKSVEIGGVESDGV